MDEAIDACRKAIKVRPSFAPLWNLLALCLSARKDYDQAAKVCEVGFKEALSSASKGNRKTTSELMFSWDSVDSVDKEDLLE